MKRKMRVTGCHPWLLAMLVGAAMWSLGVSALAVRAVHADVDWLANRDAVVPGSELLVAIRIRLDPGWHTYWVNPGDAGMPVSIAWTLPDGVAAGELQWPYPSRFESDGIVGFGYAEEVLLFVPLSISDDLVAKSEVDLRARVNMLLCEEICIPASAELSLNLPVRESASPANTALFNEAYVRHQPRRKGHLPGRH